MNRESILLGAGVFASLAIIAYLSYAAVFAGAGSMLAVTRINALYFLVIIIMGGLLLLALSFKSVLEKQLSVEEVRKQEFSAQGSVDMEEKIRGLEQAMRAGDAGLAAGLYGDAMKTYEWLASHGMGDAESKQTYAQLQKIYKELLGLNKGAGA